MTNRPMSNRFTARIPRPIIGIALALSLLSCFSHADDTSNEKIAELSLQLFATQGPAKAPIAEELAAFNDKSLIPTLVLAMRWTGSNIHVARALSELAGEEIKTWHEAYEWQERHPEIIPLSLIHI